MMCFWKRIQLSRTLIACSACCFLSSVPAWATGISLTVGSATVLPGASSSIDVDLTNAGPSSLTIGGFSFGLTIANPTVSLTDVNTSTLATYIFAGNSLFGPDLSGPNSGQTIAASDLVFTPLTGTTLSAGETLGLGQVTFTVAANAAPGSFAVTAASFPATSLSDALGNNLAITLSSPGQITIGGSVAAPEPSYLLFLSVLIFILVGKPRRPTA